MKLADWVNHEKPIEYSFSPFPFDMSLISDPCTKTKKRLKNNGYNVLFILATLVLNYICFSYRPGVSW